MESFEFPQSTNNTKEETDHKQEDMNNSEPVDLSPDNTDEENGILQENNDPNTEKIEEKSIEDSIKQKIEERWEKRIKIPEGKLASPQEKESRGYKLLGTVEMEKGDKIEFLIPDNITDTDGIDLFAQDETGEKISVVQWLLDYDDQKASYRFRRQNTGYFSAFKRFAKNKKEFDKIIEDYLWEATSSKDLYFVERGKGINDHPIRTDSFEINGEETSFEHIHQQRSGDCILAATLNTIAFNGNGHIPCSVEELRKMAVEQREKWGDDASDIRRPDSPLSYEDYVFLFVEMTGRSPRQENVITIEGSRGTYEELEREIKGVIGKLKGSDYHTLAMGTMNHARSLRYLEETGDFALLDPFNRYGAKRYSEEKIISFLRDQCAGQRANDNFFYII